MPDQLHNRTVAVNLGRRSYDIVIGAGLTGSIGTHLSPLLKMPRVFVVSEHTVMAHQGDHLRETLKQAGIEANWFVLEPGEATKSFAQLEKLVTSLLQAGIERSDTILAFGGGVIGDLAGFAASIVLRGVNFIQLPTTLLAQVDSSVGGKTGINTVQGKNLAGAFYQPAGVFIDILALESLPKRQLLAGYAEVAKYGIIDDPSFFCWLEKNGATITDPEPNDQSRMLRAEAIAHSCESKARIVAEDERETGKRALLNLGHTFGHALEAECGYSNDLLHGEAVAIGIVMALDASVRLAMAKESELDRVREHFTSVGLPVAAAQIDREMTTDALMKHMAKDKKVEAGSIGFILGGIGTAAVHRGVDLEIIRAVVHDSLHAHHS